MTSPGAPVSPNLHLFTNPEALEIQSFLWRFHYVGLIVNSVTGSTSSPSLLLSEGGSEKVPVLKSHGWFSWQRRNILYVFHYNLYHIILLEGGT